MKTKKTMRFKMVGLSLSIIALSSCLKEPPVTVSELTPTGQQPTGQQPTVTAQHPTVTAQHPTVTAQHPTATTPVSSGTLGTGTTVISDELLKKYADDVAISVNTIERTGSADRLKITFGITNNSPKNLTGISVLVPGRPPMILHHTPVRINVGALYFMEIYIDKNNPSESDIFNYMAKQQALYDSTGSRNASIMAYWRETTWE